MSSEDSPVAKLRALPKDEQARVLAELSPSALETLRTTWEWWARPKQLAPPGDWTIWLVMAGRGNGKGFCMRTQVPTPSGWCLIGALQIGDEVFDEQGQVCHVVGSYDYVPEHAYLMTFSDGTSLEVCDEHQWVTWTHPDRKCYYRSGQCDGDWPTDWVNWRREYRGQVKGPAIRTTQDIVDSFWHGKRGDLNHCIPLCKPIQCADADLPIPPYVLGAWLGNGGCGDGKIWSFSGDLRDQVMQFWPDVSPLKHVKGSSFSFCVYGLLAKLKAHGLFRNKHVPAAYLRGSARQRLELLQGFMDSDGCIEEGSSSVGFCSKDKHLADAVMELARSLGEKPTMCIGPAKLYGKDCGLRHRVSWRPTIQVFRVGKRASRYIDNGSQFMRNRHRMIVSCEPIAPKPMRCITVDSPNSMYLVGEGFIPTHNTRTGAEFIRQRVKEGTHHIILAGRTAADIRDTMILGPSGLVTCSHKDEGIRYKPSERCVVWPNGAKALLLSAEEPDQFRGPQASCIWADEVAAWPYKEAWDNLMLGFRLGKKPQGIVTTTPRRNPTMLELLARPDVHVTTGSTYENAANLAPSFLNQIVSMYEGTRIGRQELHAEILPDAGELWSRSDMIDAHRVDAAPQLKRVVVGVDPAVTSSATSDETGILVVGIGIDNHLYVLADESGRFTPSQWGARVVSAYGRHKADAIVAEANNGGDLVESNLRSAAGGLAARIKLVHASRGKATRAEPIVALYEQGKVHHVGSMPQLEDQMVGWSPSTDRKSPDRVDALVWACVSLVGDAVKPPPAYGGGVVGARSF